MPFDFILTICALTVAGLAVGTWRNPDFWSSADQRGDALFRAGKFKEAAKVYSDPVRVGLAQYRNGDFKEAASTFARVPGAVGAFDQGTALLMHGAYDDAVTAYDRALGYRPDWKEAEENKALAIARRDLIHKNADQNEHPPDNTDDDAPDAIAFDRNAQNKKSDTPDLGAGGDVSDEAIRASWLRRVQTTPADFLRIKFAYQTQAVDDPHAQEDAR